MSDLGTLALAIVASLLVAGCVTTRDGEELTVDETRRVGQAAESKLRVGDQVQVQFSTGGGAVPPSSVSTVVDERGEISLSLIGQVKAEDKTPSRLAAEIQALYVPKFYVHCNVTVLTTERFFYVGGEVKSTGRFAWSEDITLLKAINMAGSFTEYSNRRSVELTRGKKKVVIDVEAARRNPATDILILPGDSIWIPRSIW